MTRQLSMAAFCVSIGIGYVQCGKMMQREFARFQSIVENDIQINRRLRTIMTLTTDFSSDNMFYTYAVEMQKTPSSLYFKSERSTNHAWPIAQLRASSRR